MYLATPGDPGATGRPKAHTGRHGDDADVAQPTGVVASGSTPSIAYRILRTLMAESNWLGQAAPLLAALDASYERARLRHTAACTAGPASYGNTTVSSDPLVGACAPATTPEFTAAYREALSATQLGLQALRSPMSASGPTLHPALTALIQLRALHTSIATTPTATFERPELASTQPIRARGTVTNQRSITAIRGCGAVLGILSVPRVWSVVAGIRSDAAVRDEYRHGVEALATMPSGRPASFGRHRLRPAPGTRT